MPAGQRNDRVSIYTRSSTISAAGDPSETYTRVNSTDTDRKWWARKTAPSAREARVGGQQQHEVHWVFAFHEEVSSHLTPDGALEHEGIMYGIVGIYPSRQNREVLAEAVQASDEVYDNVVNPP